MIELWKWLRLGWTFLFGYKTFGGNRLRLFVNLEASVVVACFRSTPSQNDIQDTREFLLKTGFPIVCYADTEKGQTVYD